MIFLKDGRVGSVFDVYKDEQKVVVRMIGFPYKNLAVFHHVKISSISSIQLEDEYYKLGN